MTSIERKCILAIAEYRNVSKAAETLFVSQPHLSRMLIRIEGELGVKLFDRSTLPMTLTRAGECCVQYCRKIDVLEQSMNKELRKLSSAGKKEIIMGVPPIRGSYILPHVLPAFHAANPDTEVIVKELKSDVLPVAVEMGEVDIAVFSLPNIPNSIECIPIIKEPLLLMVPPEHPLSYQQPKEFTTLPTLTHEFMPILNGNNFVAIDSPKSIAVRLIKHLAQFNVNCPISIKVKNNVLTYYLCQQGMGLAAIMGVAAYNTSFKTIPSLYRVDDLHEIWSIGFAKSHNLSVAEKELIDIIKNCRKYYSPAAFIYDGEE